LNGSNSFKKEETRITAIIFYFCTLHFTRDTTGIYGRGHQKYDNTQFYPFPRSRLRPIFPEVLIYIPRPFFKIPGPWLCHYLIILSRGNVCKRNKQRHPQPRPQNCLDPHEPLTSQTPRPGLGDQLKSDPISGRRRCASRLNSAADRSRAAATFPSPGWAAPTSPPRRDPFWFVGFQSSNRSGEGTGHELLRRGHPDSLTDRHRRHRRLAAGRRLRDPQTARRGFPCR